MKDISLNNLVTDSVGTRILTNVIYNTDNSIAQANINGMDYVFNYIGGKMSSVVSGTTKTFLWVEGKLINVGVA